MMDNLIYNQIYVDVLTKFTPDDNLMKPTLHFVIISLKNENETLTNQLVIDTIKTVIKKKISTEPSLKNVCVAKSIYNRYLANHIDEDDVQFFLYNVLPIVYNDNTDEKILTIAEFFGTK